jgi:hypothetical protein
MSSPLAPFPDHRSARRTAACAVVSAFAIAVLPPAAAANAPDAEVDLYAENAWALDQINAGQAWATTEGAGATVAVVDTGIAEYHPFLMDKNILDGKSYLGADEPNAHRDIDGHGTGVAAAVLYAAPEASILPVRIDTGTEGAWGGIGQTAYDGLRWAADNGADVVVIPWGAVSSADPPQKFLEVVQYLVDQDVVVITAGGNDPQIHDVGYPASFGGVVAVSGTDRDGGAWYGNTTSPDITLAAPADTMLYPKPQWRLSEEALYFEAAGTSAAAGIAGGAAALVRAAHPELDAANVVQRLIATADDGGEGRTDALGYGRIDADAAVHADGVEPVTEHPLGYPLGAPGLSDTTTTEEPSAPVTVEDEGETASATPAASIDAPAEPDPLPVVVAAAAVLLAAGGAAAWLLLRTRGRERGREGERGGEAPTIPTPHPPGGRR